MTIHSYPQDGHARPKATADFLKVTTVTLWRWEKTKPDFPKSTRLSERVSVYDAAEIRAWLAAKKIVNQRIKFTVLSLISAIGT
ncbi:AlpA family phage regulatory protein, partial [Salmonella enterica]|nr:AlpA family phage regulatory protein [Salmonella enterica]